jgi:putative pre-16S rRNA nuclease
MQNKIIALDLGDVWTGIAISDPLHILARPLTTVTTDTLVTFLTNLFNQEKIKTIVIGYPKTMRGTESQQTKKVQNWYQQLTNTFPQHSFILWDERLTSKQAEQLGQQKTKEQKIQIHAKAAAFILTSYLHSLNLG